MFCGKCGKENYNNVNFCANCGAKLNEIDDVYSDTSSTVNVNKRNHKVGIVASIIFAIISFGIVFWFFRGRSDKDVIKTYIDSSLKVDVESIIKTFPKDMFNYILKEEGYTFKEFIEEGSEGLQKQLDFLSEYLEDDWKFSYDILTSKDVIGEELEEIKDSYKSFDTEISQAKDVEVEIIVGVGKNKESMFLNVPLVKIGRSWYLDVYNMGDIF